MIPATQVCPSPFFIRLATDHRISRLPELCIFLGLLGLYFNFFLTSHSSALCALSFFQCSVSTSTSSISSTVCFVFVYRLPSASSFVYRLLRLSSFVYRLPSTVYRLLCLRLLSACFVLRLLRLLSASSSSSSTVYRLLRLRLLSACFVLRLLRLPSASSSSFVCLLRLPSASSTVCFVFVFRLLRLPASSASSTVYRLLRLRLSSTSSTVCFVCLLRLLRLRRPCFYLLATLIVHSHCPLVSVHFPLSTPHSYFPREKEQPAQQGSPPESLYRRRLKRGDSTWRPPDRRPAGCSLLWLPISPRVLTHCLLTIYCPLLAVYCLLFAIHCPLFTVHCLLSVHCLSNIHSTVHPQPSTRRETVSSPWVSAVRAS
ncbi:unnamed protein product, partial [Penicillium salamii]